jgi:hypothetical protein
MTGLEKVINDHSGSLSLAGYLGRNSQEQGRKPYSDIDLFLLMKGGKPSDYFSTCLSICKEVVAIEASSFIFASFKQQTLLQRLVQARTAIPIHYLQYLGIRHLIVREVNTLPKYIPSILHSILDPNPDMLERITTAYTNRARILHPSNMRFYYYFDILNEALALFCNTNSNILPYDLLAQEAIHKIRFTARCVALELSATSISPTTMIHQNVATLKPLLAQLGFGDLTAVYDQSMLLETKAAASVGTESLLVLFKRMYTMFDSIECLIESKEENE